MTHKTSKYAIIVAGGKGLRMGADIPKQFLPVGGKPVLMHTISRFQSCKNGLSMIPADTVGLVGIHDGVRPFVSCETIARCFDTAQEAKAVIPVLPVTDTLRFTGDSPSGRNVQRSDYKAVQTPQVFDIQLIKKAYEQEEKADFTDDASVVEHLGQTVTMVEGNRENIKITTPFDLKVAEVLVIHNS